MALVATAALGWLFGVRRKGRRKDPAVDLRRLLAQAWKEGCDASRKREVAPATFEPVAAGQLQGQPTAPLTVTTAVDPRMAPRSPQEREQATARNISITLDANSLLPVAGP